MPKTTIKVETKSKKTGEKGVHKAISKTINSSVSGKAPTTLKEVDNEETAQEIEAKTEVNDILNQYKIQDQADEMTKFLRVKHDLPGLRPTFRYVDSRFPQEDGGRLMSVSRVYHSIKLCVDNLPDSWTPEQITAKKYGIEKAGFLYVWKLESEVVKVIGEEMLLVTGAEENEKKELVETTEDFWDRAKKVKGKPSFTFNRQPFSFTMGALKGLSRA